MSESRVTWATSVPILVFLGLSVLDLGPMYATDRRQTSVDSMWGPHDMGVANSIRSGTRVSFCILLHNVGVANLHIMGTPH